MRSPRPNGGGGARAPLPPPEFLYFSADCYEIWYRCKTSHDLKDSTIKISQGHHVGAHFYKMWREIRKYTKIRHILKESHIWGSNANITSITDLNMWYFIDLMIKEDIPYLELTYLLQLMVQTLNETAIDHIEILTQHEMGGKTVSYCLLWNAPLAIFPV